MKTAIPLLIGFALSHVAIQCYTRKYEWGKAFEIWYWQTTAVFIYVFNLWLYPG